VGTEGKEREARGRPEGGQEGDQRHIPVHPANSALPFKVITGEVGATA
jgi:hypothetical protein